jgi:hypothetical protein
VGLTFSDVRRWIETELEEVFVHDASPDLFFLPGEDAKFPFATIVTHDDEYDNASNLDRDGVYRLNFATDKETFQKLFPAIGGKSDLEKAAFDYQASDVFFPHPVYGNMRWVSVVNPETTWPDCKVFLIRARKLRELRPNSW